MEPGWRLGTGGSFILKGSRGEGAGHALCRPWQAALAAWVRGSGEERERLGAWERGGERATRCGHGLWTGTNDRWGQGER